MIIFYASYVRTCMKTECVISGTTGGLMGMVVIIEKALTQNPPYLQFSA